MVELVDYDSNELRLFLLHRLYRRKLLINCLLLGRHHMHLFKAGKSSFTLFKVDGVPIHGFVIIVVTFWSNDITIGCIRFSSRWNDSPPALSSTGFPQVSLCQFDHPSSRLWRFFDHLCSPRESTTRPPTTLAWSLHESARAHTSKVVLTLTPKPRCNHGEQPPGPTHRESAGPPVPSLAPRRSLRHTCTHCPRW